MKWRDVRSTGSFVALIYLACASFSVLHRTAFFRRLDSLGMCFLFLAALALLFCM